MPVHLVRLFSMAAFGASVACGADRPAETSAATDIASRALRSDAPAREASSDRTLSTLVSNAIQSDPGMAGSDISVNTDRGIVSLTGTVKSQEQAAVASAHAQRYPGVMRVDSHLATPLQ